MANKNLLKKIAPVILSATVAFSGMPATAFAAEFADSEIAVEENTDTEDVEADDADVEIADESDEDEIEIEEDADEADDEEEEVDSDIDAFSESADVAAFSEGSENELTGEYQYVYAGISWSQYWANESVYMAGDTTASAETDANNETDKGAFDAVTRSTARHGIHRGSFQCMTTIYTEEGHQYKLSHWSADNKNMITTDGKEIAYSSGKLTVDGNVETLEHYVVTGIKYVPVRVATADFEAFKAAYPVVMNGETLQGGYAEGNLKAYTETAAVTENTNGLKIATKNADGSFSFSARQTGSDSGLKDQAVKTADVNVELQAANGSYGEFLRVDLKGNYGPLGDAMQAVEWKYYGEDSTYTNCLRTFGTKFAADNWMHKSMGIQLGLTDSVRCQLPKGTDGTGYWTVTVFALGYQDYTFPIEVKAENIVAQVDPNSLDMSAMKAEIAKAEALNKDDYTLASWAVMEGELEECQEMISAIEKAIADGEKTIYHQTSLDEQIGHLTSAIANLEKLSLTVSPASGTLYVGGTATISAQTNIKGNITWKSSDESVATVANGVVTAKKAGTATITASISGRTATYNVTVKTPGITAKVAQVYVGKKATVSVTKDGVTGTAKFKSSNTKVATVNSKGVVTGKKAGTAKITVTVGNYKKVLTVKVKKPTFSLAKSSAKLKKGKKVTIKVKAAPVSKVTYKTSNKKVATVNSKGVVTAKKKGTATITVKCNGITKKFKVTVK